MATWSHSDLLTSRLAGLPMNPDPWHCLGLVTLSQVDSRPCSLSLRLCPFVSGERGSEGRLGGDGEQKCQRDIKQSASVCALIVQPVWFPSLPSLLFLLLTSPLYIRSSSSHKFILFSPKSLCLFCSINTFSTSFFPADPPCLPFPLILLYYIPFHFKAMHQH